MTVKMIPIIPTKPIVNAARVMAGLSKAVRDVVIEGKRKAAEYPTQTLTATGYRRTGTLKRSWSFEFRSGGNRIEGIVGSSSNIAPYNATVQGAKAFQDPMFKGAGWTGQDKLAESMEKDLIKRTQEAINNAV